MTQLINIKEAGQYIAPIEIARTFSAPFYRRCMFSFWVSNGRLFESNLTCGLGRPLTITEEDGLGKLVIKPDQTGTMNAEKTIQRVMKALGNK